MIRNTLVALMTSTAFLAAYAPEVGGESGAVVDPLADLGLDLDTGVSTGAVGDAEGGVVPAGEVEFVADSEAAPVEVAAAQAAADTAEQNADRAVEAATRAPRKEVAIAELEFEVVDFVPTQKRGREAGSSKYDFDGLAAPVENGVDDNGAKKYKYATFTAKPADASNFDADALKRSVQSATTQANATAKEEGNGKYFVTRTAIKDGAIVGVTVFRVDGTLAKEAAAS